MAFKRLAFKVIVGNDVVAHCDSLGGQRSCETISSCRQNEPQRLEPALRECSLEAVSRDIEERDPPHPSDAALGNRSFEACLEPALRECSLESIVADLEKMESSHRSDAALWNRSFEAVCTDLEDSNGPHHLEPAPWKRSLEAVYVDLEVYNCAHRSDAALWNRSFEAVC
eukprot:1019908-Amphidinium_carterae.1